MARGLLIGSIAAALIGFSVWRLAASDAESPERAPGTAPAGSGTAGSPATPGDGVPPASPITTRTYAGEPAGGAAPRAATDVTDELFSAALLDRFEDEFTAAWMKQRATPPGAPDVAAAVEDFRRRVLALPAEMGAEAARRANDGDRLRESLSAADGNALVDAATAGTWKPERKDLDDAFLDRVFARLTDGGTVAGGSFAGDPNHRAGKGLTLDFGPGAWKLDEGRLKDRDGSFPEDLTIQGAGMNGTVLTIGDIGPRGAIKRLRFRDLTVDCGDNYFFDMRTASMTLDLARVRIVRFDMGAGGSLAFASNRGALIRAQDCEFLGGYGRSPGSGNL